MYIYKGGVGKVRHRNNLLKKKREQAKFSKVKRNTLPIPALRFKIVNSFSVGNYF